MKIKRKMNPLLLPRFSSKSRKFVGKGCVYSPATFSKVEELDDGEIVQISSDPTGKSAPKLSDDMRVVKVTTVTRVTKNINVEVLLRDLSPME